MSKRVAVLASGGGSNFENIVKKADDIGIEVAGLIVDRKSARAVERAERLSVPYEKIIRKEYSDRKAFERKIVEMIEEWQAEYVILAGFMAILSPDFIDQYDRRILNIHPSLLPAFKGANGIRDAFLYGVKVSGVTVHYVDSGIDTGEIIMQRAVALCDGETLESFEEKIHETEYVLYPKAIQSVINLSEEK
ncbi:phosphoribosylglycinamide formyltransferase [Corticicoccus populi]|uniref:Phosphoribosylglycinamide formyltransferase n=1 Tax=Corticicoccus populi TaxID=1812821 RepID=A0ABW5WV33_9STAP